MEWYQKGDEGHQQAKQEDEQRQRSFGPRRLWLPPDRSVQFTFLDTEGFFFKEHNLYLNKSWMNWETCIQDIGEEDCPQCENGMKYSYVCVFTILDHSEYRNKKDVLVTINKKLIVLKATARNKVLKQKERRDGDLTFCRFETTRYTGKECSTGEDFEYIQRYTPEEMRQFIPEKFPQDENADTWLQPYNYAEMFKPKSAEELRKLIGATPPVGSDDVPGTTEGDDPKPSVGHLL